MKFSVVNNAGPELQADGVDLNKLARRQELAEIARLTLQRLHPADPARPDGKRMIFTVTNGRTGSDKLHTLFHAFDGVCSLHEPDPNFRRLRARCAANARLARNWLRLIKLPAIAAFPQDIYIETSHLFSKGYLQPMLDLGYDFDAVILRRPARQIALSMSKLSAIPGGGRWAAAFYVAPGEPGALLPSDPSVLTNRYRACYWHALEVEARQDYYSQLLRQRGRRVVTFHTADLSNRDAVMQLFADLDMPMDRLSADRLDRLLAQRVNVKVKQKATHQTGTDYDVAADEAAVEALVGRRAQTA